MAWAPVPKFPFPISQFQCLRLRRARSFRSAVRHSHGKKSCCRPFTRSCLSPSLSDSYSQSSSLDNSSPPFLFFSLF